MKKYGLSIAPLQAATRILGEKIKELKKARVAADRAIDTDPRALELINFGLSSFIPYATLMAFRAEIGLKAALEGLSLSVPAQHKLNSLFEKLPQDRRTKIESLVSSPDFSADLQSLSNAFVDWRYFFEKSGTINFNTKFLTEFTTAIENEFASEIEKSAAG